MKRIIGLLLAVIMIFAVTSCSNETKPEETKNVTGEGVMTNDEETKDVTGEGVMTYDEYVAADIDSKVVVETYVQAKQSWWDGKATIYTQDNDGAYFIYSMPITEEEYNKLEKGTKIKVTGFKSEWSGEIEITDAEYEIEEGTYIAEATDVTAFLANEEELIKYMNRFVSFKGLTVEAAGEDEEGNEVAYLYSYDGSGSEGDDLYFKVSLDGKVFTFTVESYLCGANTDIYKTVKDFKVGDKVDLEGFLYWYNGVNPHITGAKVAE